MKLTRREATALGVGTVAMAAIPALAKEDLLATAISEFTHGAEVGASGVSLTAPEIAENGNTVPVSVDAPGAEAVMLLAAGNPTPGIGTFKFGPGAGTQSASSRIRLAKTQDVIAIAKMADGSFAKASQTVKVTIGGCGG